MTRGIRPPTFAARCLLPLTLFASSCQGEVQPLLVPTSDAGTPVVEATTPPVHTPRPERSQIPRRQRLEQRLHRRLWWHKEESASRVGVTADQMQRLDALADAAMPELERLARALFAARDRYREALARGAWDEAGQLLEERTRRTGELAHAQARMTIAGLRLLRSEQRTRLAEIEPLDRPWVQPGILLRDEENPGPGGPPAP